MLYTYNLYARRMALSKLEMTLEDVKVDDHILGKGAYGLVLSAVWKGVNVAAKKLHDNLIDATSEHNAIEEAFFKEAERMTKLRHPNIVQCFGIYNSGRVHIILERMHYSLYQVLAKEKHQTITKVSHFALSVASALRYLHEQKPPIAHRDVTPKNILFNIWGDAKLSDLGVSKQVWMTGSQMKATKGPGNPKYMPPEVEGDFNKEYARYDPVRIDSFSLGVVMLEAYSGVDITPSNQFQPSKEAPGRYDRIPEVQRRQACFKAISSNCDLTKLICQCMQDDPKQRPTALEIQLELESIRKQGTNDTKQTNAQSLNENYSDFSSSTIKQVRIEMISKCDFRATYNYHIIYKDKKTVKTVLYMHIYVG